MTVRWILLPLFALFPLSLGQLTIHWFKPYEGDTLFISYNGTIAGQFRHTASAPPDCPTYYFDSLKNSFIFIGVNPPWDTNPFWFGIQRNDTELDGYPGYTADPIYNLQFKTAGYRICVQSLGDICNATIDDHWAPQEDLDLNKATIVQYDWGDAGKGYSVAGDQSTYGGGPPPNSFDFQRPDNYSSQEGCVDQLHFQWNSTVTFTYALNFTNTTAEALFSLTAKSGTVTFSFLGTRVDVNRPYLEPYHNGNYTPISLNTSDPSKPTFTFVNGSQYIWKNRSHGLWSAVASAPPLSVDKNLSLWLKWLWLLLMVVTGGLFTL